MVKELRIILHCDGPHDDDTEAVTTRTLTVDGSKPRELDLCADCDAAMVAPLAALLDKVGQPVKQAGQAAVARRGNKPREGANTPCSVCGGFYSDAHSLRQHMRKVHGLAVDGTPISEGSLVCEHCHRRFVRPQGKAVHIRTAHPEHYHGDKPFIPKAG